MDEEDDSSKSALKIVFVLSSVLVIMDLFEIYLSYCSIFDYSTELAPLVFEHCAKYHIVTQMFFTTFATLAGVSACIMSLGLLINEQFFATKLLDTFVYFNYYSFGPLLLGCSVLGFLFFNKISYNCDSENYNRKFLNISTVACICVAFIISFIISGAFSIFGSLDLFNNSIRFTPDGSYILGKVFWKYVFNRGNEVIRGNSNLNEFELDEHRNDLSQELDPNNEIVHNNIQ